MTYDIHAAIPHREPFLLLDEIIEISAESVRAAYTLRGDDPLWALVYQGHYPGNPLTPGVLLCEMVFQAAAVMVRELAAGEELPGVPMVTRIQNVKFRNVVPPGSRVEIRASLAERLSNAFFMKGGVWLDGKAAMQAEFAVAMAEPGGST